MRTGTVHYHRHAEHRQAFRIDPDGETGRLIAPALVPTEIELHDARDEAPSFVRDGVVFLEAPSAASFSRAGWQQLYEAELVELLTSVLGAQTVLPFDHTFRTDDPNAARRPARNVHTDLSPTSARERLHAILGDEDVAWAEGHYAFVNVWRPLSEVVQSAPLGFVRPRTVQPTDWLTLDLVYPSRVGEILGLVANPAHEWVYRSAMTCNEVAVFNIYDNRGRHPVAHSAIDLHPSTGAVRRSLETRLVVRYAH
jgi:hypothetical protein